MKFIFGLFVFDLGLQTEPLRLLDPLIFPDDGSPDLSAPLAVHLLAKQRQGVFFVLPITTLNSIFSGTA